MTFINWHLIQAEKEHLVYEMSLGLVVGVALFALLLSFYFLGQSLNLPSPLTSAHL